MSNRKFSIADYNARHFVSVEAYVRDIEQAYNEATKESVRLASALEVNADRSAGAVPFSFERYPAARSRFGQILQKLSSSIQATVLSGMTQAWNFSNQKNDALVGSVLQSSLLSRATVGRYMARNLEALAAFQQRKVGGLGLSDRVFNYTNQFRSEIEMGLDIGLGEGRSAAQLSRDLRGYLNDPNKLFCRVRDKRGQLVLSQNAKAFHPGQGVYRSSYKNAVRMTRTEINSAYHTADQTRWKGLDFVVGFEVRRSNNKTVCDVCDSLKGFYPKTFVWHSWHPSCRCNAVPVLATADELAKLNRMLLSDQDTSSFTSQNAITEINPGFVKWLSGNQERLARAKSLPWFVSDNI